MKHKYILYFLAFAATFITFSCSKDYLETNPSDSVSSTVVESSTTNLMVALNGVHRYLYAGSFYNNQGSMGQGTSIIMNDLLGEDYLATGSNWFGSVYQWRDHRNVNSIFDYTIWQFYYGLIGDVNAIIGAVDKASGLEEEKKILKGESFAYRAWSYFYLVQYFAKPYSSANLNEPGVILREKSGDVEPKARSTVQQVYQRINADLDSAIENLADDPARNNVSHLDLSVAQGLKARVALVQGDWAKAAEMAAKSRAAYKLMDVALYKAGFSDYNNPEWIWGSHQASDANSFFSSFMAYCGNFSSTHNRTVPKVISINLYNQINATDVRKTLFDPTGTDQSFPVPTSGSIRRRYMQRKFLVPGTTYVPSQYFTVSGSSIGDVPLMRAAEMYLIEAEAKARLGNEGPAKQVLFELAKARDAAYTLSTKTGQDLIDEILLQRRIELWGEGFRFFDLKRLGKALDRTGARAADNSWDPFVTQVPVNDVRWIFLIPQAEMDANGLCTQNPL